jgi:hypothetical protein
MATQNLKTLKTVSLENKAVKGIKVSMQRKPAPLLPHERDQSTAHQGSPINTVIKQASKDIARGLKDTDRGEEVNRVYQKLKSKR